MERIDSVVEMQSRFKALREELRKKPPTREDEQAARKEIMDFGVGLEAGLMDKRFDRDKQERYLSIMFYRYPDGMRWWYPGLYKK